MPPDDPADRFFDTPSVDLGGARLIEFGKEHPALLLPLLKRFLETIQEDDIYLASAVSMLPADQVVEAAATAVGLMQERADWSSAYRVIQSASAQFPDMFRDWRETILDSVRLEKVDELLGVPSVLDGKLGPIWRGSPAGLLDRIENIVRDSSLSDGARQTFARLIFASQDWSPIRRMTEDVPVVNGCPLYFAESECLQNGF
jgi:hypothetical protein